MKGLDPQTQYTQKKVCFKCKKAQSRNRTFCLGCGGDLRLRKAIKTK